MQPLGKRGKEINIFGLFPRGRHAHIWVTGRFGPIYVRTPGRFASFSFRSGRFGLSHFGPILGAGRFGPILVGRFGLLYFIKFLGNKGFLPNPIDFMQF